MRYCLLIAALFLAGCSSTGQSAKSLVETLEWGDGECGEFVLTGNVNVGPPVPGFGTDMHMTLEKSKPCGEVAPQWKPEVDSSTSRPRNLWDPEDGATTGGGN